jgi:Asp-tRNA(Asn)/Glu-tRNA(Gln) amidotransferase A subunit family amidase
VEVARPEVGDPFEILLPLVAADTRVLLDSQGIDGSDLSQDALVELELLRTPSLREYVEALNALTHFRRAVDAFFEDFDLMLTPATAVPAFPLREPPSLIDGRPVEPRWTSFMPFQAAWNLAGQPTASLPCGSTDATGLPIGLQVTGPRHCDDVLLDACEEFERARPWGSPGAAR